MNFGLVISPKKKHSSIKSIDSILLPRAQESSTTDRDIKKDKLASINRITIEIQKQPNGRELTN